jgi:hypothetical protein
MIAKAIGTTDGNVIRLDEPLGLPRASRVELTIAPLDVRRGRWNEFIDDLERLCDEQPIGSGGRRCTRDELHERR